MMYNLSLKLQCGNKDIVSHLNFRIICHLAWRSHTLQKIQVCQELSFPPSRQRDKSGPSGFFSMESQRQQSLKCSYILVGPPRKEASQVIFSLVEN